MNIYSKFSGKEIFKNDKYLMNIAGYTSLTLRNIGSDLSAAIFLSILEIQKQNS